MRTLVIIILFFVNQLVAMENNDWPKLIKGQLQNYKLQLKSQYKCICTNVFHTLLSTSTKQEEIKKTKFIEGIIHIIKSDKECRYKNLNKQSIYTNIVENLSPFDDEYSKNLHKTIAAILVPKLPECIICFTHKIDAVFSPCGHSVACVQCLKQITAACPICKKEITKIIKLNSIDASNYCLGCDKERPKTIFPDCQHSIYCTECATKFCKKCTQEKSLCHEVFINKK